MSTQYFTLKALSVEFDGNVRGAVIREVFTQEKNELIITFSPREGADQSFIISIEPSHSYIIVHNNVRRAKRNSVDLFSAAIGVTITRVEMCGYDRVMKMILSDNLTFMMQLYNTAVSNIFLVDDTMKVHESFKRNKELAGTFLSQPEKRFNEEIINDSELFRRALLDANSQTAYAALKHIVPILGSVYAREIMRQSQVDEKATVKDLSENDIVTLQKKVYSLFLQTERPVPSVYSHGDEAKHLSVLPLTHLSGERAETFASMNDAVRFFIKIRHRTQETETESTSLLDKINGELERSRRAFAASSEHQSAANRADEYDRNGNLLMAHLPDLAKGMIAADLPDMFSDGKSIRITLDPKRSPVQNAEQYFEKSKKAKAARREIGKRIEELRQHIDLLEQILSRLHQCHTLDQVQEFERANRDILLKLKLITKSSNEQLPPFRVFTVVGGYEVWVGKSSANNDLLTMKYTKPHDLWFHARGASGSHTVLKVKGGSIPPKEAIRQAAAIAAYYSKMRNASTVPVAYCERKHVRKPKRANEGSVFLEREEVIFVHPGLP
jgi:predicted ribosome quality control (RQC) complex YloA/Tae2 family protein